MLRFWLWAAMFPLAALQSGVGDEETTARFHEDLYAGTQIANDISCDMCGFVAEDLWTTLVTDWSANSERGEIARDKGASQTARQMLEQLCQVPSPIVEHFLDLYRIKWCEDGHTADGRLCLPAALHDASTANPKQRWFVLRSPDKVCPLCKTDAQ